MRLTVTTLNDQILNIEVSEDLEIENLKAQCEFELGIPASEIVLVWNGRPLIDPKRTLSNYGVQEGDMLLVQHIRPQAGQPGAASSGRMPMIDFGGISIPGASSASVSRPPPPQAGPSTQLEDPRVVREILINDKRERALLKERNPPLSEALESGSVDRFVNVYTQQRQEKLEREREKIRIINMDPFEPEAQRLIAEDIRLKNVELNMETAIEYVPESFGQVVMLYIDCLVNGHPVKAFVDSGAQMTIMSQSCAERCGIMRLVDTRWAGIAKGVGTQKIIGRVHLGQIQIGQDFLQSSFSILENQPMDMLLGLDMLKRHQCCIDLQKNELIIGTTGTTTKFLPESQLPEHARILPNPEISSSTSESEDRQLAEALQRSAQEAPGQPASSKSPAPARSPVSMSTPPSSSSLAAGGATGVTRTFPEVVIQRLMAYGHTRERAIEELSIANGDENQALAALIVKSISTKK